MKLWGGKDRGGGGLVYLVLFCVVYSFCFSGLEAGLLLV